MKKLILGLLTVAIMVFGLVGAGSTAAHAGPYPGSVKTTTKATLVKVGKGKRATFAVTVKAGAAKPTGRVQVTCTKGGKKVVGHVKSYGGAPVKVKSGQLKRRGVWRCVVKFTGGGVYKSSKVVKKVRVRR